VFTARGIPVVIAAEHHASLLGSIGSNFLSLDIWVDGDDAEDAAALLRDLRSADADDSAGDDAEDDVSGDLADDVGDDPALDDDRDDDHGRDGVRLRTQLRRQTSLAILLGCCLTFGTAHMSTGAWARGVGLAVLEFIGFLQIFHDNSLGVALVIAAIGADLIGALSRIRAASQIALPAARVRRA
jgi:hypothetical protein